MKKSVRASRLPAGLLLALALVSLALAGLICVAPSGGEQPEAIDTSRAVKRSFREGLNMSPRRIPDTFTRDIYMPDYPIYVGADGFLPDSYRYRLYSCSINARGFRGPRTFDDGKGDGVFRVACYGTGVTFGEGVDDDRTYCWILQDLLARALPGRKVEVLNLGLPCLTTPELARLFLDTHRKLGADCSVICAGVNDSLPMFEISLEAYGKSLDTLLSAIRREKLAVLCPLEPVNTFYPWPEEYEKYRDVLREKLRREGIPSPDLPAMLDAREREGGLRLERRLGFQQAVRYRGGKRQVLFSTFSPFKRREMAIAPAVYTYLDTHLVAFRTFITDVHLNEEGHRLVARELMEELLARRPGARPREE